MRSPPPSTRARRTLAEAALDARLASERVDVTLPARPGGRGPHPSDQPDHRRDRRDLRRDGLRRRRGAGYRGRFPQFHRPQHPARASGAPEHDTFYLPERPDGTPAGAAHPHLAGADPHDADAQAADPHHRARPHLSLRQRHDPLADVPPGRGAGDRRDDPYGPSQGLPDRFLPRLFRHRRPAGALPPELSSRSPSLRPRSISAARARAASSRSAPAATGWRSSAAAWSIRKVLENVRHRSRRAIRASPSAWGSSASRC